MVVREYLVENFGFDDSQLKTLGMGKQTDTNSDGGWGTVQILIYPAGTEIPPDKQPHASALSKTTRTNRFRLLRLQHRNHSSDCTREQSMSSVLLIGKETETILSIAQALAARDCHCERASGGAGAIRRLRQ